MGIVLSAVVKRRRSEKIAKLSIGYKSWQELSKLLVNPPEARLLANNWPLRLPGSLPFNWRSQEAPSLPSWYRGPERDSSLSKIHRIAHPQTSLSTFGQGDCPGFQDRSSISICCYWSPPGSIRSLPCWSFRGHQLVRYPCQARDHYAQRHPIGSPYPW